ncbi:IclR family transcriptional regulator [Lutispora sp.]|uniref:IclR family transcriptional regulator n=1 Tax=Lutispora sp. TaxID=2828727 RepID=UPI002B1E95C8|nr:IclR family transcriptional regulator [Lutispora sp.]MEA4963976.1 IclR family transcriptional regulator [Lutispora sp.]
MENYKRVQSIDRAVSILKCFSKQRKEMKLSEIADELSLNKSTVHGIISTLKYNGLIDQDEETQKYRLGLYLMKLGDTVASSIDIRDIAHPIIKEVSQQLNETVHLSKLDGDELIYLDKVESNQSMRIFTTIGSRMPAYCTGMGKAMLAYIDDEKINNLLPDALEPMTEHTITDKNELLKRLADIREKGYAMDNEENSIGLRCIAAPIFDHKGNAKYAISVSGPTVRMTDKRMENIISIIKDSARKISYKLGYEE